MRVRVSRWPSPFKSAFSITDDPDHTTSQRVRTIYDFCEQHGVYPTRGTWVLNPRRTCGMINQDEPDEGVTLEDPEYLELCRSLQSRGFEIGLHGVSSGDNKREDVAEGIEKFQELLGAPPRTIFFHSHNAEHLYWGASFTDSKLRRMMIKVLVPHKAETYEGHLPGSDYFCGDLSFNTFSYTRLFRTMKLNTLRTSPEMPFHIYDKPFVRHWFSTTAEDLDACALINDHSLAKVAHQDGLMLIYAHMGEKFVLEDGSIHPTAARAIECVGRDKSCWKTGTSNILDRCLAHKNLIISSQRDGVVISNPSKVHLQGVQVFADTNTLITHEGQELEKNEHGAFVIENLPPRSTVSLFRTPHHAQIDDPKGISRLGVPRMQFEEIKRLLFLRRLKQLRKKLGR